MKLRQSLSVCCLLLVIILAACAPAAPQVAPTTAPLATQPPVNTATSAPAPTQAIETATVPVAAPTEAAPAPSGAYDLDKLLYFLADQAVWALSPGDIQASRVTAEGISASAVDVWPGDNRLAYGTGNGQVWIALPGEAARMVFDAAPEAPYPPVIDSVSWSPDGARLAFTVQYAEDEASFQAGTTSEPSGLWLYDLNQDQRTWLASNRYLTPEQSDVNLLRALTAPVWSPDGTALLLTGIYWEWIDMLLFDPLEQAENDANLNEMPEKGFGQAAWALDGSGIFLSGRQQASVGDLLRVSREDGTVQTLIDGEARELRVYNAVELPRGVTFLANCPTCQPGDARLYIGQNLEDGFTFTETLLGPLCGEAEPLSIQWDAQGSLGAVDCGEAGIRALRFTSVGFENVDLQPFLVGTDGSQVEQMVWGGEIKP
jgi:hypothetical protein